MTKNELLKKINYGKISGAQSKISQKLKVSTAAVSNWFNGKTLPTEENLKQISKNFNVDIDILRQVFYGYNDKENNFFQNNGNIIDDNKGNVNINSSESVRLALLEKDFELLKKEVEIIKLKMNK